MVQYQFDSAQLSLMEASPVPFAIYQFINKRVVTLVLSAGFRELFGFDDRDEAYYVMDNDMYRDAHPDDVARVAEAAVDFATGKSEYDVVYRTKRSSGGDYIIVHSHGAHISPEPGITLAYVWYCDEGSYGDSKDGREGHLNWKYRAQLHNESQYRRLTYDYLTGLPNMTFFFELATTGRQALIEHGESPAVAYFDFVGISDFNRKNGFTAGDRLIQEFAKILVKYFGNYNSSRFGQDHFAVFSKLDSLEDTLKNILQEFKQVRIDDEPSLPVKVGIYPNDMEDVDVALACDRAKYACNSVHDDSHSTIVVFNDEMLSDLTKQHYIIDNIDKAIEEGWITAYYQPIIRAANGRVSDEEALARWIEPGKGILSPAEFIPILEDAKLIYKVDLCIVEQALRKMKEQMDKGLYIVPVSINLSRSDFDSCDIVEEICKRVDDAGMERSVLSIEITESIVGSDFDFMKDQIERLRSLGFKVWVDDFGSGYSSLDMIQSIRFDLIKLDMRFMQQFTDGDESKIILTELIKMAIGLNVDTIAEGVETPDQVEFLKEIGCTKLQGFYYCKPIPQREIMKRYETGVQIGFENPEETDYYAAMGRINLYDLTIVSNEDPDAYKNYFDTFPMSIIEYDAGNITIVRCNRTFREYALRVFGRDPDGMSFNAKTFGTGTSGAALAGALDKCANSGGVVVFDAETEDGATAHSLVRRIAVNPVSGVVACVAIVLEITDGQAASLTYAHVAHALSADYFRLFYVDLETERFIEYTPETESGELAAERHGADFFAKSRNDARTLLYEADQDLFIEAFTRENVMNSLNRNGSFTQTYRQMINGKLEYLSMKAVHIGAAHNHIIIGLSIITEEMRHREAMERIKEERVTYARISALNGDYLCIYTVDPVTNEFVEYGSTAAYDKIGIPKHGSDFFTELRRQSARTLHPSDLAMFYAAVTKRNIMREVKEHGLFAITYRLYMDGEPKFVRLKAAIVDESNGRQLIIGVTDIDAQTKREKEYERMLLEAQASEKQD